jgi:aromatase
MAAHTDNAILISAPLGYVWEIANDVGSWPKLFPEEYAAAEILERTDNRILFRLSTHPQENGRTYSWVSERVLDPERFTVTSRRVETGPFLYMHIFQSFEECDPGTTLRWVQDFEMAPGAPFTDAQMAERINRNSRTNLVNHKEAIESGYKETL